MTTEQEIKEAEAAVEAATEAASQAHGRLNNLYIRRSTEKYGIEIGMKVREKRKERVVLVTSIRPDSYSSHKPWLYGKKIKKDGTPGDQIVTVFGDWEIVAS